MLKGEQGPAGEDVGKSVQGENGECKGPEAGSGPTCPRCPGAMQGSKGQADGHVHLRGGRHRTGRACGTAPGRHGPSLRSVEAKGGVCGELGKVQILTAYLTTPHWRVHMVVPIFCRYSNSAVTFLMHVPLICCHAEGDSDRMWGQLPEAFWLAPVLPYVVTCPVFPVSEPGDGDFIPAA